MTGRGSGAADDEATGSGSDTGTEFNAVGDVVRRAGGMEAVELVHSDGTISRLSEDTVLAEPPPAGEPAAGITVTHGSSWHRVADVDDPFRIDVPNGSASSTEGIFTVVCEPNGSAFVVCLDGAVMVSSPAGGIQLHAMQAVDVSPGGDLGEKIDVAEDELRTDPWIAMNLELGSAAAEVTASARAAAVPTTVEREPAEPAPPETDEAGPEVAAAAVAEAVDEAESAAPETAEAEMAEPETAEPETAEAETEEAEAAEAETTAPEVEAPAAEAARAEEEGEPEAEASAAGAAGPGAAAEAEASPSETSPSEEEEELEPAELEHDRVVVVGRGTRRQPTLWVALVLALIAAALFALGRRAEDQRPVAGSQIEQNGSVTTRVPATTAKPPATTAPPTTGAPPTSNAPATTAAPTTAPTTAAPTTAPPPAATADVSLTRCSQSGSTIAAEGAVTNTGGAAQSYRIVVKFLGADGNKVAEATATVQNVQPKQKVSWKGTGSYAGDLKGSGGCQTERVDLV